MAAPERAHCGLLRARRCIGAAAEAVFPWSRRAPTPEHKTQWIYTSTLLFGSRRSLIYTRPEIDLYKL